MTAIGAASIWPRPGADQESLPHVAQHASADPVKSNNDAAPSQDSKEIENTEFCKVVADYARSTMDGRQNGVAMSKIMDLAKASDPAISPILTQMVIDAYDMPRMSVERNRETAVRDFENETFLSCVKQTR